MNGEKRNSNKKNRIREEEEEEDGIIYREILSIPLPNNVYHEIRINVAERNTAQDKTTKFIFGLGMFYVP